MMRFVCHESRYNTCTYRMADRALSIVRNSKSLVDKIKRMLLICEPLTFENFAGFADDVVVNRTRPWLAKRTLTAKKQVGLFSYGFNAVTLHSLQYKVFQFWFSFQC